MLYTVEKLCVMIVLFFVFFILPSFLCHYEDLCWFKISNMGRAHERRLASLAWSEGHRVWGVLASQQRAPLYACKLLSGALRFIF